MRNNNYNNLKRIIDVKRSKYSYIIDTVVRNESPSIYGEPISIKKDGKILHGNKPNFKLIDKIENMRSKL